MKSPERMPATGEMFEEWRNSRCRGDDRIANSAHLARLASANVEYEGMPLLDWLVAALRSGRFVEIDEATDALATMGPAAGRDDVVQALIDLMPPEAAERIPRNWIVRTRVIQLAWILGANRENVIRALLPLISLPGDRARDAAAWGLRRAKDYHAIMIPEMQRLLDDPSDRVRARALEVLGGLAPQDDALIGKMLEIARKGGTYSSDEALRALGVICAEREEVVEVAIKSLDSWSADVTTSAIWCLTRSAVKRRDAFMAIVGSFAQEDYRVQMSARNAIESLVPLSREMVDALESAVRGADPASRATAIQALRAAGLQRDKS